MQSVVDLSSGDRWLSVPAAGVAIYRRDALAGPIQLELLARRHGCNDDMLGIDAEVQAWEFCWPEKGAFSSKISLQVHALSRTGWGFLRQEQA